MKKHTPTLWIHEGHGFVSAPNSDLAVAECYGDNRINNAEFIVRACNAHEELLTAAKHVLETRDVEDDIEARKRLFVAIAKAEGK